jgi:serine/threonine protein kinase/DNA-binding beta-propeller fold protein YncE
LDRPETGLAAVVRHRRAAGWRDPVSEQFPGAPGGLDAGSYVAGYRLEQRIGRGGMAAVFRAYDSRLDRLVALKVMAPALAADEAFRKRFIRESRAAAAVDDPHIIPVYAAGEADGILFIAMRLVRGGDVLSLIDQIGPLPAGRAAEIISQVASALDAAHARGLVHRDVKPANMLLEASQAPDRPDHVYLSDFGLTKASLAMSGLTSTGQFLGTLDYVAPEQIESRPVDGRTDQYSLACAAFELLTGEPPFRRGDSVSVMYAQLNEPPPLVRGRRPDLPADVDAVLGRALAKVAADRYESCRAFAAALRRVLGVGASGRSGRSAPAHPATEVAQPVPAPPPQQSPPQQSPPLRSPAPERPSAQPQAEPQSPAASPAGQAAASPAAAGLGGGDTSRADSPQPAGAGATQAADYPSRPAAAEQRQATPGPATPDPGVRPPAQTPPPGGGPATGPAWNWPSEPPGRGGVTAPVSVGGPPDPPGRRPWWRSPLPVAGICVVVLLAGGGAYALSGHGKPGAATATRLLSLPGCSTKIAPAPVLTGVHSSTVSTGGQPFGIAVAPGGQYSFVTTGSAVVMLRNAGSAAPTVIRTIAVPGANHSETFTPDGKYLLVASGSGADIINVAEAEQGAADPILGKLKTPDGKGGAFQPLVTPDGRYAFVTQQSTGRLAVFNLQQALTQGVSASDFVGYVQLGGQPVGMVSDGQRLYVTNLGPQDSEPAPSAISILSVRAVETNPGRASIRRVPAGCGPARAMLSADKKVLWVTARDSDALLGFSTAELATDPGKALVARVMVGESPLGETFADGGRRIVLADSNLNGVKGAVSDLAVVDPDKALAGRPALLGYVPTGDVPRAVATNSGGATLLVTDEKAGQVQVLRVADLK